MKLIEIFQNFIDLSFSRKLRSINKSLEDIYLQDYVILRKKKTNWVFYFLLTGNQIVIPYDYISIMTEFEDYQKGEVDYILSRGIRYNRLEKFISNLLFLIRDTKVGKTSEILTYLDELCNLGTTDFREMLNNSEIDVREFEFRTIKDTKRI